MLKIDINNFEDDLARHFGRIKEEVFTEVKKAANETRSEAVQRTPVKTGQLRASWQVREKRLGDKGEIQILNNTKYWAAIEYGTKPRIIRAVKKRVLANRKTGEVFGKQVNHPGTRPRPMIRPAVKKVVPMLKARLERLK